MKTATDYRAEAARQEAEAAASFERCDTDGFLTQWAQGLNAQLNERKAKITEAGGVAEFIGLYQGDRRVAARRITTQYGTRWVLAFEEQGLFNNRQFLPTGANSRVLKQLGLAERRELAPAWAVMGGRGTGLSGQAWVETIRAGHKYGLDATLIVEG